MLIMESMSTICSVPLDTEPRKFENLKREPGSLRAALAASATTQLQILSVLPNFLIFMSTYAFTSPPPPAQEILTKTAVYFIESIL